MKALEKLQFLHNINPYSLTAPAVFPFFSLSLPTNFFPILFCLLQAELFSSSNPAENNTRVALLGTHASCHHLSPASFHLFEPSLPLLLLPLPFDLSTLLFPLKCSDIQGNNIQPGKKQNKTKKAQCLDLYCQDSWR